MKKHICLIGMPGSGKTTLGKLLAAKLEYPFLDLDKAIEQNTCKSIHQIFEEKGEAFFREKEKETLIEALNNSPSVIALGGGTPAWFDNMDQVNKNAFSIYIETPLEIISERLLSDKTKRPLISEKSTKEIVDYLKQSFTLRKPFYEKADHIIHTRGMDKAQLLQELVEISKVRK